MSYAERMRKVPFMTPRAFEGHGPPLGMSPAAKFSTRFVLMPAPKPVRTERVIPMPIKRDGPSKHQFVIKTAMFEMRVTSQNAVLMTTAILAALGLAGTLAWAGIG